MHLGAPVKGSMLRLGLGAHTARQSNPSTAPALVLPPGEPGVPHGDPAQDDPELVCAQARLESPRQH